MTIATYSDLVTAVGNWLNRADLTPYIPDFIDLAEDMLNGDLKTRSMEAKSTLSTVAGTKTVSLPPDMLEMRRLQVLGSYNQPLSYRSPDELSIDYADNRVGQPVVFTVVGSNIELAPVPDAVYSLELTYQQRIPALTSTNTTNWLIASWPSAYLYGTLLAAEPFLKNDERLPVWQALYQQAVDKINGIDWYSGSTMKVRAR
ncbi:phage adaptor protein [Pseudomonas nitroreducens]|uniref:phage adaptor protein n=1 Tax=Pseudomonas nitroreducens TaxID=46680 RepID=UPI002657E7E6|nr:hypothetical protein [Pseudomonas nitroreducens]MCP1651695.1 hypothetical protein [Pseudomonas nitroreducens]MCP1684440.1 hypothetical protein [Pseudomonas nitroreducens]